MSTGERSGMRGDATGRGRGASRGSKEFGHVGRDRSERLKMEQVAARGPSGMSGMVTPPSEEAIRRSVEAGICPMCGQGPYKVVSVHTNKKHGVDRFELREMAGMTLREPTCLPEFSQRARELAVERGYDHLPHGAATGSHRFTQAGRRNSDRATSDYSASLTPEERVERARVASLSRTPEAIARHADLLKGFYAGLTREERRERAKHLARPAEDLSEQSLAYWDARGRKPCGTRASYRRGCRCEECREAYLAYRRARKT